MNKLIYTRPDGGVSIVVPAPKADIERIVGPLTDFEYKQHVIERSIPADAINVREITDLDIPSSREFRNAWKDITPESNIDICCTTAKELKLAEMRRERNLLLDIEDKNFMIALEKGEDTSVISSRKQELRDITEPLKALNTTGKVNDENVLQQIKDLSIIN